MFSWPALQHQRCLSDEADIDVVMDVFDSNKDGTINYGEFLFMFVDRQAILRRWEHKAGSAAAPTGMSMQGMYPSLPLEGLVMLCRELCVVVRFRAVLQGLACFPKNWSAPACGPPCCLLTPADPRETAKSLARRQKQRCFARDCLTIRWSCLRQN
jgi:hypothetical protein